jgi:hypothetical protein
VNVWGVLTIEGSTLDVLSLALFGPNKSESLSSKLPSSPSENLIVYSA